MSTVAPRSPALPPNVALNPALVDSEGYIDDHIRRTRRSLKLVDAAAGMTPADLEAADLLRRATAPVIVAVNKADNEKRELEAAEFHALGWEETYLISASHGRGTGDLLDAIVWALPPESEAEIARKQREAEAEAWADEVAAGRLEPFVVDEPEEDLDGEDGAAGANGGRQYAGADQSRAGI